MTIKHLKAALDWVVASGLSLSAVRAMLVLPDSSEPFPIGRVSAELGISSAAMTGVIDRLAKKGLAQRSYSPEDRRTILVSLTNKGRALFTTPSTTSAPTSHVTKA